MRMRKKKHLEERLALCTNLIDTPPVTEDYRIASAKKEYLDLAAIFGRVGTLHLEIGCGKGRFICEAAKREPDIDFIAVEVCRNVLIDACAKAMDAGLKNVVFLHCGADVLLKYLPQGSVSRIYLNFSCPFPKTAYANRRLTNLRYLDIYKKLLVPNGEIHQKTDNMHFFEYSLEQYSSAGCRVKNVSLDLHAAQAPENIETEYEEKFASRGFPIYRLLAVFPNEAEQLIEDLSREKEILWLNRSVPPARTALALHSELFSSMDEAGLCMRRFSPVIASLFPETAPDGGRIESPLTPIPAMQEALSACLPEGLPGALYLKRDCDLPIAGSVKARGGVYEVLRFAEALALQAGLLSDPSDDHEKLLGDEARSLFGRYRVQIGSTGNLGLSIGTAAAALGFRAVVHMSADAKEWKKALLRSRGATVIEYSGDYGEAVRAGRASAERDPFSYFVDDERSRLLFSGYSAAAPELREQLRAVGIEPSAERPLFVYLPCGVGGAPGGLTFGLKRCFGDAVRCFIAEPTAAPCMLLGRLSERFGGISVREIGLSGATLADGLAVGRCSAFAGEVVRNLLDGGATVEDGRLRVYLRLLNGTEGLFIEPSAAAAFHPLTELFSSRRGFAYLSERYSPSTLKNVSHVVWATGGSLVPENERASLLNT